jgi:hypothetical protein
MSAGASSALLGAESWFYSVGWAEERSTSLEVERPPELFRERREHGVRSVPEVGRQGSDAAASERRSADRDATRRAVAAGA